MKYATIGCFLAFLCLGNAMAHKPADVDANKILRIVEDEVADYIYCPATYNGQGFRGATVSTGRANPPYKGYCMYPNATIELPGNLAPGASTWQFINAYGERCYGPVTLCPFVPAY